MDGIWKIGLFWEGLVEGYVVMVFYINLLVDVVEMV